jgi:hypothetical protein
MKSIFSFLLQVALGYVVTLFFPWWSVVIIAFVVGFSFKTKGWAAFLCGFAAMLVLWIGYATFMDFQNGAILSEKMANLFQLPESNYLIYLTGFIGGLLGGMGSLTGQLFRETLVTEKKRYGTSRRKRFRHLKED